MPGVLSELKIRFDPWRPDFGAGFQATDEIRGKVEVDCDVEYGQRQWAPLAPQQKLALQTRQFAFIDGVRRLETRIVQEAHSQFRFGAIGSLCAGVVCLKENSLNLLSDSLKYHSVKRVIFLPHSEDLPSTLTLSYGADRHLLFHVTPVSGLDPNEALEALQQEMRAEEAKIAEKFLDQSDEYFVIADGPLNLALLTGPIAGYIKSLYCLYVPEKLYPVLSNLRIGERSPLFFITEESGNSVLSRYSAFVRILNPAPRDTVLAGMVRLEVSANVELAEAQSIMDSCAVALPRFASLYGRDPRAPQNLTPLAALEQELKRRLGDARIIRRILQEQF